MADDNNNKLSSLLWRCIALAIILYALFHDRTEENKRSYERSLQIYNNTAHIIAGQDVDDCIADNSGEGFTEEECYKKYEEFESDARKKIAPEWGIIPPK